MKDWRITSDGISSNVRLADVADVADVAGIETQKVIFMRRCLAFRAVLRIGTQSSLRESSYHAPWFIGPRESRNSERVQRCQRFSTLLIIMHSVSGEGANLDTSRS